MRPRRLTLASAPKVETAAAALRAFAVALAPYLRELLVVEADGVQLVDVAEVVPLPRRTVYKACRRGDLAAVKRGRRWLATRSAVDAWVRIGGPRLVRTSPEGDDLEEVRRSLMRVGPRRRTR
jgi:excisionase family DNA binding protein